MWIPVVGWLVEFLVAICLAVPFYVLWHSFGLGQKFFFFLPLIYVNMGFWEMVGLFLTISILKSILLAPRSTSSLDLDSN